MTVRADTAMVRPLTTRPNAAVRLFCFPYAGGGSSMFRAWGAYLPDDVDVWAVQLPGREDRISAAPIAAMDDLLTELVPAVLPHLDRSFSFFGHSMGALVCWELTRALQALELGSPTRLFVSASHPPHDRTVPDVPLYELPDHELVQQLSAWRAVSDQVLRDAELVRVLMPAVRADLAVWQTYAYRPAAALRCPVSAFGGEDDDGMDAARLARWGELTDGDFEVRMFPGGHFFLNPARAALLAEIANKLIPGSRPGSAQ